MVVRKAGAIVCALAASCMFAGATAAEPLKIGIIESLSGTQTSTGKLFEAASLFIIDEINAKGGFNGEPIQVLKYDNAGGTTGAADKFKQAVADGVHVVLQGASSAIAGQVTADVNKHNIRNPGNEILYINLGAEAQELTGELCHFYHFRMALTAPMRIKALVPAMKKDGALGKRLFSIHQNYSWGHDMEAALKVAAKEHDFEVVDWILHDVNKIQDFSPFVAKIKAANPDSVITGNWSNDLLLLMKATGDAGLDIPFGTMFLDQVGNLANAGETAVGHFLAHSYNIAADKTSFPNDYKVKTGHYPVYIEPQAVNAIRMLSEALSKVNFDGKEIDVTQIAKALERATIDTPIGPISIRAEDHQAVLPIVISKVVRDPAYPVDDTEFGFGVVDILKGGDVIYPVQESCEMKRPS